MASSLFTALSGLQTHQDWLDVIGNNLANANTPGFKSERATFADNFSQTLRFASSPQGAVGGTNPLQVGGGVRLADVARNFSQGAMQATGRIFDLAIEGRGFFSLSGPNSDLYTRVGTFGLDADSNLVDQRSGLYVNSPSGQRIQIDTQSLFPPSATTTVGFAGNLPATVTGPLAETLTTQTALADGTSASLTGTQTGPFTVPAGETWTMDVIVNGEAPQQVAVTSLTGTIVAQDIVNEINASVNGVSAQLNGGVVEITTAQSGEAASIKINPGAAGQDLALASGLSTTLVTGSQVAADATTNLNDLPANEADYQTSDGIDIVGVDANGSPVNSTFIYGTDGTTVGDLVNFIDGLYANASVTLNPAGQIVVTADTPGEASMLLSIADAASSNGQTDWSIHGLSVTTDGTGPDEVDTSMEVFDSAGTAHTLNFTFQRQGDGSWNIIPSASDGQILSNTITGLSFAEDGSPLGLGGVDTMVSVQFENQASPQMVSLDFGLDGSFDGLTQFGAPGSLFSTGQDGYTSGELANMSVDQSGEIVGFYNNGQSQVLGSVGITIFANEEGLQHVGSNMWQQTVNSGARVDGAGATGGAGVVVGGNLERSNVDTAAQFVSLIEAQRGYQANARIISAQDDLLQETVNLI